MGRSTAALMSFGVIPGAVAVYAGQLVAIEQREGTGHVIFEPLDFSARLAGLVPSPAVNLTRYHGVFAPNRALIVPAQRGRGGSSGQGQGRAVPKHVAMHWAQRPQTRLRDRDQPQRALRRSGQDHRQHRRS